LQGILIIHQYLTSNFFNTAEMVSRVLLKVRKQTKYEIRNTNIENDTFLPRPTRPERIFTPISKELIKGLRYKKQERKNKISWLQN